MEKSKGFYLFLILALAISVFFFWYNSDLQSEIRDNQEIIMNDLRVLKKKMDRDSVNQTVVKALIEKLK